MAFAALRKPYIPKMTVNTFLAWDDGTDTRYELVGGEIFAMAPPSAAHSQIVANLAMGFGNRLKHPCRVATEAGVRLAEHDDAYYQADVVVHCQPVTPNDRQVPNPKLVIEVLSPSTASFDRGTKTPGYCTLSSVNEIMLVSSTEKKAEIWRRNEAGWQVNMLSGEEAVLHFESVGVDIPLATLYEGIVLQMS